VTIRSRWLVVVAALVLSACQPNRFFSGWVPYWGGTEGRAAISDPDASSLMSEVSLLWFGTAPDGSLPLMASTTDLNKAVAAARANGLPVIPTIFDSSDTGVMRAILHSPSRRNAHIARIVGLVTSNGYDGIDLDYEVFAFGDGRAAWPSITPDWITFVRSLGAALHARGKLLSVTVPPVWDGGASGYTVYAQDRIAADVDRLRLMVYDWSTTSPGPIAPVSWVKSVIAYSSPLVPTSKLQLGVPAYGRHWRTKKVSGEICPDGALGRKSVQLANVAALAVAHKVTPVRHSSGEITFGWDERVTGPSKSPPTGTIPDMVVDGVNGFASNTGLQPAYRMRLTKIVTCTVRHIVFSPDAASIRQRVDLALAAKWSGAIVWALGYENTDLYRTLGKVPQQRPNGPFTVSLDVPAIDSTSVRVTGVAYDPQFDLPAPVTITLTRDGSPTPVATRTISARANANVPAGLGPFHGIDTRFNIALTNGSYTVCAQGVHWGGALVAAPACRSFTSGPAI
jgi:spore germination protein YaaH